MPVYVIGIILFFVGAIVLLLRIIPTEKVKRSDYLHSFAHFFEGQLTPIPEHENSYRVNFLYRGYPCIYEDIELPDLRPGVVTYTAYLKVQTTSKVSFTFSERARTQIRSNAQTLEDVSNLRWGTLEGQVRLPKILAEFQAYTNNSQWANKIIDDPKMLKIFTAYKNRDFRGHPLMSLQIVDGVIALEFHSSGELKPSLMVLEHNVTAAETYLQELLMLAEALKSADGEKSK